MNTLEILARDNEQLQRQWCLVDPFDRSEKVLDDILEGKHVLIVIDRGET